MKNSNKRSRVAVAATFLFHAALLVLFMIFGLSYTYPPPNTSTSIRLGFNNNGFGEVMPATPKTEKHIKKEVISPQKPETSKSTSPKVVSQDDPNAINVPNEKKNKKVKEQPKKKVKKIEETKKTSDRLAKAMAKDKKRQESEGKGEKKDSGADGRPDGESNTDGDGKTTSSGDGISFDLSGRRMTSKPKVTENFQEEGIVVVKVTVNKYGEVVKAIPGSRGSTTTSSRLLQIAKTNAQKAKFDSKTDAPVEQIGTITFVFKLK